ncbi:hypothetical protein J1614_000306 [Plenodomus biglobosus]|nr:hypothetical protein J1614_000306 [Plenodomus biglobosus]
MRLRQLESRDESAAVFDPPAPQISLEKLAKLARESSSTTTTIKQQQTRHREFAADSLDWVMRPVSFATPVSKEIQQELYRDLEQNVEAERAAWNDLAL